MIRIRERSPLVILLAGVVLAYIAGTSLYAIGMAHGDTGSAAEVERVLVQSPALTVEAPPANIATIIALILGALGAASGLLHFIAPRTQNKVDDALSAKVDELLALLRMLPLPPAPAAPVKEASPVTVNVAGPAGMLAILLLGAGLVTSQVGCSGTAGQRTAAGIGAALDCGSPALKEAALAAGNLAQAAILSTVSGSGHVDAASFKAALTGIKDAGLMCAVAGVVAALATPAPKSSVMASGLEVDAAELQRVFAMAKADLGWPQIKATGG